MNKRLAGLCDTIILFGLPLTGAGIALMVFRRSFNPLYVKTLLLHAGSAIVFAAWLIKRIEMRSVRVPNAAIPLLLPALLFLVSALVSYFFITPYRVVSHEELVQRIPYFLVFLVAVTEFTHVQALRRALVWLSGSAFVAAAVGIVQHFQIDLFDLKGPFIQRIPSTFGNPNFYVGFLALVIPVALSWFYRERTERGKPTMYVAGVFVACIAYYLVHLTGTALWIKLLLFIGITAATVGVGMMNGRITWIVPALLLQLLTLNILLTSSRSGHIALAAGLAAFMVLTALIPLPGRRPVRRTLAISACVLAVTAATVGSVVYFSAQRKNSVSERKYYVLGALDLIREKPVFGGGIGTFKVSYPLVKPREAWAEQTLCFANVRNVYNEHLEVVHDEGVIGGLLFYWMLGVLFVTGFAALRKKKAGLSSEAGSEIASRRFILAAMLSGIIALLISNAFSLSMRYVSTGYHFWYLLGLTGALIVIITAESNGGEADNPSAVRSWSGPLRYFRYGLYVLIGGAVIAVIAASTRVCIAGIHLTEGVELSRRAYTPRAHGSGEISHDIYVEGVTYHSDEALWEKAIQRYLTALTLNPRSIQARYFLGNAFNRRWNMNGINNPRWGDPPGVLRTDADRALEQYRYLQRENPHYTEVDYEMGNLYMKLGKKQEALHWYLQYKKYKPYFIKINQALARCYRSLGNWEKAESAYLDALDNNEGFTMGNIELSIVYNRLSQPELEREFFSRAFEQSPLFALNTVVREYENLNARDKALSYCDRYADSLDNPAPVLFQKGWLHVQDEDWPGAIAAYRETIQHDSTYLMAYINLSNVLYAHGEQEKAEEVFQKAIQVDPGGVAKIMEGLKR